MYKIIIRERDEAVVIDSEGQIRLQNGGSSSLRDMILKLIKEGKTKIVLNLLETSYVDSSGIGEMVSGFTNLSNHGGELKLLALSKRFKDLLRITKLYTVFEVFDNEDDAIRSFK